MIPPATGDGFVRVDKPVGMTSHDAVAAARRALGIRRIGHTGTLDPFATGLLLLGVGRATRLAEYLGAFPKEYLATARLGEVTDTLDPEGEVTARSEAWRTLAPARIEAALRALEGEQDQLPPLHSAKKVRGEPAHRRVRRGEEVTLAPARITVHEIELLELALPHLRFRVLCSTGSYVRAIARDLGEALGVGAHLRELRRTAIGPHRVEGAPAPDRLGDRTTLEGAWITPLEALGHLPRLEISLAEVEAIEAGRAIAVAPEGEGEGEGEGAREGRGERAPGLPGLAPDAPVALACGERLVAVARLSAGVAHPKKVFPRD